MGEGPGPLTHSPEQKSRSSSPPKKDAMEAQGSAGSHGPGPPGSGTFLSRPIVCTESLSDEEPHLGMGRHEGQGRTVSAKIASPTHHPQKGQDSPPSKDRDEGRPSLGELNSKRPHTGSPKRSQSFNRNMSGPARGRI